MKLEKTNVNGMDLREEKFWEDVRELMRYGIPAYDKKGHWVEIRVRARPLQIDMISAVREKMPDNWFKSQAALHRSILAVGCKVMLKLLDMEDSQWNQVLMGLNKIAKQKRLEEFRAEMTSLKTDIANGSMTPQEKVKVIDIVSRLEQKIMEM